MKATDLLIWGIVVHLLIDWLGQNEWIAVNKAKRRQLRRKWHTDAEWARWTKSTRAELAEYGVAKNPAPEQRPVWFKDATAFWDRHPAAYIHAGMHGAAQLLVFPWWAALAIGITHLLIDTRVPVAWWSKLIRQTQPEMRSYPLTGLMDIGTDVRIWADQVWHIGVIAALALVAA